MIELVQKLLRLSNPDYYESPEVMYDNLKEIQRILKQHFPNLKEEDTNDILPTNRTT
ncbi:MAG: hypothetical protein ABIP51_12390 [Bacteroidia bacterium]